MNPVSLRCLVAGGILMVNSIGNTFTDSFGRQLRLIMELFIVDFIVTLMMLSVTKAICQSLIPEEVTQYAVSRISYSMLIEQGSKLTGTTCTIFADSN